MKKAIIEAYNLLLGNCLAQVVSQSPRFLSRLVLTSSKIFLEVGITKAFKTLRKSLTRIRRASLHTRVREECTLPQTQRNSSLPIAGSLALPQVIVLLNQRSTVSPPTEPAEHNMQSTFMQSKNELWCIISCIYLRMLIQYSYFF